jgi:lipoprotein-anchoring transpeptidase ErfK/SrfK
MSSRAGLPDPGHDEVTRPGSTGRAAGPVIRWHARLGVRAGLAITVALLGSGCGGKEPAGPSLLSATTATGSPSSTTVAQEPISAGMSVVATARGKQVAVRTEPDGKVSSHLANPTAIGAPLTFLVLESRPGWYRVQLPVRPNGSSGWVAEADVTTSNTPYRLVVSMSRHQLDVLYEGRRVARHRIGVGKVATPTPKGTYYLTELIQPPNPKGPYGPNAFGLSVFSDTLQTFAGGPGQLGLHGTDAPKGLGTDISHGCIRVSNSVIRKLADELPLGTPIDIRR